MQSPIVSGEEDSEPNQKPNPSSLVFAAQENTPGGRIVRTIGMVRAKAKIGLANLVYNIGSLIILERIATA